MGKLIGYARINRTCDGSKLNAQIAELKASGCVDVFLDIAKGSDICRPGLGKAFHALESGDTLVVTRLDRFSRDRTKLLPLLNQLLINDNGIKSLSDTIEISPNSCDMILGLVYSSLNDTATANRRIRKECRGPEVHRCSL